MSVSRRRHQRRVKGDEQHNIGTQTEDKDSMIASLGNKWTSLYTSQDWKGRPLIGTSGTRISPAHKSCHICGPQCLHAQNVFIPNLEIVRDLMRQQVEFTQQFCDSQKYLYHSLVDAIQPNYVYTTLKDTKEYIKKHRKPKLTMKKALKMVELETRLS